MPKYEVIMQFHDRKDDVVRKVGDIAEADERRVSMLETLGFVKRIAEKTTKKTTRKPKKTTPED